MKIEVSQILLQLVNFTILVVVLTRLLYRPILKILAARAQKIQEGLEAAEKSLEEQAKAEEKHKAVLAEAEKRAGGILEEARQEAKNLSRDIVETAKVDAQAAVEKEYKILKGKLEEDQIQARKNLAKLVTQATEHLLAGALSKTEQKRLVSQQIKSLKKLS